MSETEDSSPPRNRGILAVWVIVLLVLSGCAPPDSIPQGVQVYFSPNGGATDAVVNALDHATNSVLVQAYSFTSAPIAKALVAARRRGVDARVILDKSGSFNFTKAAEEHNAENLLLINDPVLAKQYADNWWVHQRHSEGYDNADNPPERSVRR